ncbi:MAG TPA: hypothetical protein VEF34_02695 [Syntrophobacteraceae bacterium]|nr:hypothetical protein [Syntrophobacteraceae bacterium]
MSRLYLAIVFSAVSLAGLAMILYAILTGSRRREESPAAVEVGFSGGAGSAGDAIFDLDIGHEGLKHREKEPFDPSKHKPLPL